MEIYNFRGDDNGTTDDRTINGVQDRSDIFVVTHVLEVMLFL